MNLNGTIRKLLAGVLAAAFAALPVQTAFCAERVTGEDLEKILDIREDATPALAPAPAPAAAPVVAAKNEKAKRESLSLTGEVTAASASGLAVQFGSTAEGGKEIYLPADQKTKLTRLSSLAQLKPGDTVKVDYERRYEEPEKGKKIFLGAVATGVTLLSQAPAQGSLVSSEEKAP